MPKSAISLKEIRKLIITGIIIQYVPLLTFGLVEPLMQNQPGSETAISVSSLLAFLSFILGFVLCGNGIDKYARHKGYKNYLYIFSILNVSGLSILFLLNNKNSFDNREDRSDPLLDFSISTIFISLIAIPIAIFPLVFVIALYVNGVNGVEEYISNSGYLSEIFDILIQIIFILYFFRKLRRSNIDYKRILGSLKRVNFKLPIILTIVQYFFNGGINCYTLYGLSFVIPQYVENRINYQYAMTIVGYIAFAIGAIIFAPILEEFFFRGVIFQKLALTKGIVKAMLISAIAFALVHFRYDVIPLFIFGILYVILYLKTKQLAVPILAHFFYNAIAVGRRIYAHFFADVDPSLHTTVAEYQQQFLEHWQWDLLYIALSAPYLCYFIYKNFPRGNDINRLPYFTNQRVSG